MYSSITVCITRRRRFTTLEYQHAALGLLVTAAVAVYSQNDPHALPDIYWTPQRPKHCRVYMNFVCIHHNRMAIICIIVKTSRFTTKCKGNKVVCLKRRVFFQNGGHPPYWTSRARIWTTHDNSFVVCIFVQNLRVSIFSALGLKKNLFTPPKIGSLRVKIGENGKFS